MKRTQCRFKRGNSYIISWIDSKYAKKGLWVELIGLGKELWEIISVGSSSNEDMSHRYKTYNNNI